jgi:hypothetical protein
LALDFISNHINVSNIIKLFFCFKQPYFYTEYRLEVDQETFRQEIFANSLYADLTSSYMIAMIKKTFMAVFIISAFLVSIVSGIKVVEIAKANVMPMQIYSPTNTTYNVSDIPLDVTITTPQDTRLAHNATIISIFFSLDDRSNDTLSFYRQIDSQEREITRGIMTLFNLTESTHKVAFYYENNSGTFEIGAINFAIDTALPTVTITLPKNETYLSTSIPLDFNVNESASWIGYSLDSEANITVMENTTLRDVPNGYHSLTFFANDTAGNMAKSDTVYFTVTDSATPLPKETPTQQPTLTQTSKPVSKQLVITIVIVIVIATLLLVVLIVVGLMRSLAKPKKTKS